MPADEPVQKHARVDIAMADTEPLRVKKLSEHATLPVQGSAGAAGYDLSRCACFLTNGRAPAACAPRDAALGALSLLSPFPPAPDTSSRTPRSCAPAPTTTSCLRTARSSSRRTSPSRAQRAHTPVSRPGLDSPGRTSSTREQGCAKAPCPSLPTSLEPAQHRPVCVEEHACVWIMHALSKHTLCSV